MTETYNKWVPAEEIENEIWVEALYDDYEGLRILLKGSSSRILRISFDQYYVYRNADESYRDILWTEAAFEQRDWSLCITTSSKLSEWLYEESGGVYSMDEMVHYLIKTGADVVEVVVNKNTPPKVEWLGSTHEEPTPAAK